MFAPGAQTPRPPGKAGRYESTLEGLRALQTSRKRFVNGLKPCCARLQNPPHMSPDSDFILEDLRPSTPLPKQNHPQAGRAGEAASSPGAARFLSI